jgi:hypothetical protein
MEYPLHLCPLWIGLKSKIKKKRKILITIAGAWSNQFKNRFMSINRLYLPQNRKEQLSLKARAMLILLLLEHTIKNQHLLRAVSTLDSSKRLKQRQKN